MSVAGRAAKLRAMAEHPRSNPNEAALARAELERLERLHPGSTAKREPVSWVAVGRAADFTEFERLWAEMQRQEEERLARVMWPVAYAKYKARMDAWRARRAWHDEERRLYHRRERRGAEVKRWIANLRPGDQVRTLHDLGTYEGPPLPSEVLTIERRTPSGIVVTTDGRKWNANSYERGRKIPGLLRYIAPVTGW